MGFVRIEDLKVHYPIRSGFFNRVTDHVYAVDGVSLEIEEGKTYGLVGESGSGKSTIGKSIIGLEHVTSGKVIYEGEDVTNKARRRTSDYNRNVQMIFQDSLSSFNPKKRILDIVAEPLRNFERLSPDEERKRVLELMEIIGLSEEALLKYPHQFSGGQRQRLAIARALARKPEILIFDDSFSALDYKTDRVLRQELAEKTKSMTKLIVAQRISTIMDADLILVLDQGKVVGQGTHRELLANNEVYQEIAYSQLSKEELEHGK